ncbi:MAG: Asp-tRNA(Asn)/Glu-tRNA(Gln) amidotransferase GatCAB subunit A [Chloroflexi bacterium]|nr:Asp-tRNA(Asn)/Glu-tRNA(Gln) amidotransferase GatCAB subunit A [Chloroflexota bacterium]|tara:strand:- start:17643 stop:19121 length:1479 start_codon:yes stop_codon:yes gene_type:complete
MLREKDEILETNINDIVKKIKTSQINATDLTTYFIERIERIDSKINSVITIEKEQSLKRAEEINSIIKNNKELSKFPLLGIPIIIKDNISTKNLRTTAASKILSNYTPTFNATVITNLINAGAIIIGKANMDEFAMGSSNENSAFGPVKNPWDFKKVPGGSSGGPAASVASGLCIGSLGSDTGGSIRQPAALCGIVGLKPTYGLVSRFGLIAFGSSLDQIGPMTKSVEDCAEILEVIAGYDKADSTSSKSEIPKYTKEINKGIKGMKIGIIENLLGEGIEKGVSSSVNESISILKDLGATVSKTTIPLLEQAVSIYYLIAPSEASSNLARYDGFKYGFSNKSSKNIWETMEFTRGEGFGDEVKRRILIGTYALSSGYYDAYYKKAQQVRTLLTESIIDKFKEYDALISPTSPCVAFDLKSKVNNPLAMYLNDICTIPANIAGVPAISIPCKFSDNLPVGLQIMGPHFSESKIMNIGNSIQKISNWHKEKPRI